MSGNRLTGGNGISTILVAFPIALRCVPILVVGWIARSLGMRKSSDAAGR